MPCFIFLNFFSLPELIYFYPAARPISFFTFKATHCDPIEEAWQKCREGKDNPFSAKYFISSNIGKSYFAISLLFWMDSSFSFAEVFFVCQFQWIQKSTSRERDSYDVGQSSLRKTFFNKIVMKLVKYVFFFFLFNLHTIIEIFCSGWQMLRLFMKQSII